MIEPMYMDARRLRKVKGSSMGYSKGLVCKNALEVAHDWVRGVVSPGDVVIDATVGNGHDTLLLAEAVGERGRVYGFDIQGAALASARDRLRDAGVESRVTLLEQGHETMEFVVREKVTAVMFNLGYLPGNDTKDVITRPDTTLAALAQATELLALGGLITVVLYTGHPGGVEEAAAVREWVSALDQGEFSVVHYQTLNQKNTPPALIGIERLTS